MILQLHIFAQFIDVLIIQSIAWRFNSAIRYSCLLLRSIYIVLFVQIYVQYHCMQPITWFRFNGNGVLCHNHDCCIVPIHIRTNSCYMCVVLCTVYCVCFTLKWTRNRIMYATTNNQPILFDCPLPFIHSFDFGRSHISVLFRLSAFHSNLVELIVITCTAIRYSRLNSIHFE